jgi:hypothetical protein
MAIRAFKCTTIIDNDIVRVTAGGVVASPDKLIEAHDRVLNAITQKFHNSTFLKYMEREQVHEILVGLQSEYGTSIAASEAFTEQKLFLLKCHDDKKLHKHLDDLADLKNKLSKMGITVSDRTFQNAIITSIPKSFMPIVTALNTSIAASNTVRAAGVPAAALETAQLVRMLKNEADLRRIIGNPKSTHYVNDSKTSHKKSESKGKGKGKGNLKKGKAKCPAVTEKDATCFKCGAKGHKSNNPKCPEYSKNAKQANSSSKGKGKELTANIADDDKVEEAWTIVMPPQNVIQVDQKYLDAGRKTLPPAFVAPMDNIRPFTKPIYANLALWAKDHAREHSSSCRRDKCYWHYGDPFDEREYLEFNPYLPTADMSLDK